MKLKKGKLVFGVGINDADYIVQPLENGKRVCCPYYRTWTNMLKRCYSIRDQRDNPTYVDCWVCDEWLYFMTFRAWMIQQNWEGNELDKDLLIPNNKEYSPQACVFVSSRVNSFCVGYKASRNSFPIGVSFNKKLGKYVSQGRYLNGEHAFLGYFEDPDEAHIIYKEHKKSLAIELAKMQDDVRISEALLLRYS